MLGMQNCPIVVRSDLERSPSPDASIAAAPEPGHPVPICRVDTHKSPDGTQVPVSALDIAERPFGRCDQRPSGCRAAWFSHRPSVCPPGAPPAESNCPTTSDSRFDTDYDSHPARTLPSTRRLLPLLPGLPSPAGMLPTHHALQYKTASLCP